MNQSRNRKSNFLTTLALGAAGLVGLAGCETTNRRETPTPLETLLRRELGTSDTTQVRNSAQVKLGNGEVQSLYRVLQNLGNTDAERAVNNSIVSALETQFQERMNRFAAPAEGTPTATRLVIAPYLHAQIAPGFEKNDHSEMLVNLPGPNSGKLTFVNGKFTTFALVTDSELPATINTDYFRMQARLENGKNSLVYAADGAPLASSVNEYFTPATGATISALATNSLAARALRTAANGRFGANDNLEGELLYARGSTDATNTVYALQTPDGRTRVTATDLAAGPNPAQVYAQGEGKDRHVRLIVYGRAPDGRIEEMGIQDAANKRDPWISLADLHALNTNMYVPDLGAGRNLDADMIVNQLFERDTPAHYATTITEAGSQLRFTPIDGPSMQILLGSGKVKTTDGQVMRELPACASVLQDVHYGLFLD